MNPARVRVWTRTLYAVIQSFSIAKRLGFGRLDQIEENVLEASDWVKPDCSYESVLKNHPMGTRGVTFRLDPLPHIDEITRQLISMLVQDLATILDDQMDQVLAQAEMTAGTYPMEKAKKLKKEFLHGEQYVWAYKGCIELIVCRNVMAHAGGRWNERSITDISEVLEVLPTAGDLLTIGFDMLFRYRKAIRTFISQTEIWATGGPKPRVKRIRVGRSPGVVKLGKRQVRKIAIANEMVKRAAAAKNNGNANQTNANDISKARD